MDIESQLKCLIDEKRTVENENMHLKNIIQSQTDEIYNLKVSKLNSMKEIDDLKKERDILVIQLQTYKEDFSLERKDRESAQSKIIDLERDLLNMKQKYQNLVPSARIPQTTRRNIEESLSNDNCNSAMFNNGGISNNNIVNYDNTSDDLNSFSFLTNTNPSGCGICENPSPNRRRPVFETDNGVNPNSQIVKIVKNQPLKCTQITPNDFVIQDSRNSTGISNLFSKFCHKKPVYEPFCFVEDGNNFREPYLQKKIQTLKSRSLIDDRANRIDTDNHSSTTANLQNNISDNEMSAFLGNNNMSKFNLSSSDESVMHCYATPFKSADTHSKNHPEKFDGCPQNKPTSQQLQPASSSVKNIDKVSSFADIPNDEILQCPGCSKKFHISKHFDLILHSDECTG
ncbi:hypothetical protein HELRODRAFT_183764 [Helobdella robusta]|uniref:Uncharacterized protein n=1 Tax=Helobdella robusta TaxID=6412 RepID=T1FK61_HELRO|nr:hypothetical protein HELRODRAFT_183764 [Helobdella robusta]ESO10299.1 hypothetical protein HELRODRAFT_183764 [Helobdella robusta]